MDTCQKSRIHHQVRIFHETRRGAKHVRGEGATPAGDVHRKTTETWRGSKIPPESDNQQPDCNQVSEGVGSDEDTSDDGDTSDDEDADLHIQPEYGVPLMF